MQIAVVGAGIIGLTIAHRLAEEGHGVLVIAREGQPHCASTGNAGTIATYAVDPVGTPDVLRDLPRLLFNSDSPLAIHRPSALGLVPWLLRFARQSLPGRAQANRQALAGLLAGADADWRALAAAVGGADLLQDRGALYAYDTPEALAGAQVGMARRRGLGVAVDMLGAEALQALEPSLPEGRFAGAALFPGTIWLTDPATMLARIAAAGAERLTARVTALEPVGAGWRIGLATGEAVEAGAVVLAAGAWSASLLRPLGIRVPLTAERGYHLEFDGMVPLTRPFCPASRGFYFTPMQGRLRAAGTVELGGIDAPPSPHRWDRLEDAARSVFPDLPPPSRRWMGLRPSIPDSLPVVGTARKGLVLAFGHGHIGLTLAPKTAELVSRALDGEAPLPALSPARF
ncbi:NAD(P)/FAD-dependent oxidoreductase [Pararhodobacter zhoushanensis]|uniref:FAD-dependent oxidoreductase n=1 Tax=Pararhodobacter zhoushanensis TaxID=2479545 RepID=A0ABT3H3S0_9RHOB|nr:FAD-dependent oxidoreductase [Pararhodobacter zhoushanensis]MCW1934434.1 FAD-dependent oxidoreductase [Pararhodobacter zhoushanensis]